MFNCRCIIKPTINQIISDLPINEQFEIDRAVNKLKEDMSKPIGTGVKSELQIIQDEDITMKVPSEGQKRMKKWLKELNEIIDNGYDFKELISEHHGIGKI